MQNFGVAPLLQTKDEGTPMEILSPIILHLRSSSTPPMTQALWNLTAKLEHLKSPLKLKTFRVATGPMDL